MFSVIELYLIAGRYNCENNKTRQKIEGLKSEKDKSEKTEKKLRNYYIYKKGKIYINIALSLESPCVYITMENLYNSQFIFIKGFLVFSIAKIYSKYYITMDIMTKYNLY